MRIRLPETINDCRPEELAKWLILSSGDFSLDTLSQKMDFRVQVVSIFSGFDKATLETADYNYINKAFNYLISMLSSYVPGEPTGRQVIEGVTYVFPKNFEHTTAGQVIDIKLIEDIHTDPCEVLSILYIEEGLKYNQIDERKRVINPHNKRKELFKKHFDGEEFLNVFGFFFDYYEKRRNATLALSIARTQIMMEEQAAEMTKQAEKLRTANGTTGPVQ